MPTTTEDANFTAFSGASAAGMMSLTSIAVVGAGVANNILS